MLAVGCEGAIDPSKKTNEGLNTLYFTLDGETISSGGRAPDWVVSIFSIFNPHAHEEAEDSTGTAKRYRAVRAGYNAARDTFWISAILTLNSWDAKLLEICFPAQELKEGATIEYPKLCPRMTYCSGYYRDESFPQGYAFYPVNRSAEFISGSLHIRSLDQEACIVSGEFKFKVRMISEGIANETFGSGGSKVPPSEYVVRPRTTVELAISRGTFDIGYGED